MKLRDVILVTVLSLGSGWLILQATLTAKHTTKVEKVVFVDTTKLQDTIHSVKGKKVLFIGDSHTAFDFGWQHQVATKTGMSYLNTAVGGKQTTWMLETAKQNINSGFDYCFIYGGANDMAGNRAPIKAVRNIQRIVDLCKIHNVKAVVVTGFDPLTCVKVGSRKAYREYPQRYARFQQLLIDSIHGAEVIKTHCISRTDCGDFLCHMTASGHKKMAAKIILDLHFQKI
jgi:lysophospholipase L1-like esterase